MIIEHPYVLGPDEQLVGIEPVVWMDLIYGDVGELVLHPIESKTGPALYDPMFAEPL